MRFFWRLLVLGLVGLSVALAAACASDQSSDKETVVPPQASAGSSAAPTTQAGVEDALAQAQQAFLQGDWGTAVVQSNRVMEGAATPEEYYDAIKILGMASCNRKDPGPVEFAWSRLTPVDREGLKNQCAQQGLGISEQGKVSQDSSL